MKPLRSDEKIALDGWYESYNIIHVWRRDDVALVVIKTNTGVEFVRLFGHDAQGRVMISIDGKADL